MYYLAPLVRVTKARRSLRAPVGYGETETSWVIIGDRAILWARDPINDARLRALAEGREEKLAAATRSVLAERVKDREFRSADRFVDTVANLLRAPGQNPWAALRPSKRRRRYEILLGPREDRLFWSQAVAPRKNTVVYTDDFSGNGNLDGRTFSGGTAQWEVLDGTLATSGGVLQANNIPDATWVAAVATADADTDELFAQVTQTTWSIAAGNPYMESNLGVATNDDLSAGYFLYRIESSLGGNGCGIFAADSEDLVDRNNAAFSQTGLIRIERDGSTIRGFIDEVEVLSGTHTGEPTGAGYRLAGIRGYALLVSTNDLAWDNFSYGDLPAEPVEASADITVAVPQVAATVQVGRHVSAALTLPAALLSAASSVSRSASGELDVPAVELEAAAWIITLCEAALGIPAAQIASTASIERSASATLTVPSTTLDATASTGRTVSAAIVVTVPAVAATATTLRTVSAAIETPAAELSASAARTVAASADISAPAVELQASASIVRLASGDLAIAVPVVDATAAGEERTVMASLAIPAVELDASALISRTAQGALVVPAAEVSSGVEREVAAEGLLILTAPSVEAQAAIERLVQADIELPEAIVAAQAFSGAIQSVIGLRASVRKLGTLSATVTPIGKKATLQ